MKKTRLIVNIFPQLQTKRLNLRMISNLDIPEILDFYRRNAEHFRPWSPVPPADFFTTRFWKKRVTDSSREFEKNQSLKLFMFSRKAPGRVLGSINLTNFFRGPFQACFLGYSMDKDCQGKGLMQEALQKVIEFAFSTLKFHRIMANHHPANHRSARVLRRLGFHPEGYARDYLFLNGEWQDHVLNSLINQDMKTL